MRSRLRHWRLLVCVVPVVLVSAQQPSPEVVTDRSIAENPTYSTAVLEGRSPDSLFRELEGKMDDQNPGWRFRQLPFVAKAALEAGNLVKAKTYAEEALKLLDRRSNSQSLRSGEAEFYCNMVLGRIAVLKGDLNSAEQYLLLSGKTEGSPSLKTFGPNMSLARELLLRDPTSKTVLNFFKECETFWRFSGGQRKLHEWSMAVESGRLPAFGANLFY